MKTRGEKAAAAAAAAPQPAAKSRRKGGSASPGKKPAGSAGARGRGSTGRASADRASVVADVLGGVTDEEEPLRKAMKGEGHGPDAAPADRASVAADAPEGPPAEEGEEAKLLSADVAPSTAKPKKGEAAAPDPSPAYLKAQVRTNVCNPNFSRARLSDGHLSPGYASTQRHCCPFRRHVMGPPCISGKHASGCRLCFTTDCYSATAFPYAPPGLSGRHALLPVIAIFILQFFSTVLHGDKHGYYCHMQL